MALFAPGLAQVASQLVDATRHHVIANHHAGPDLLQQLLARNDIAGVLRQHEQHLHDLGVELLAAGGADHLASLRIHREITQTMAMHVCSR